MAQMRAGGGYGLGAGNPYAVSRNDPQETSALDAIREQTSKIEDMLDSVSEPIKPYVSSKAPFQPQSQFNPSFREVQSL